MLANKFPTKVLPALSGGNANWGFDNQSIPYSPGEGQDVDSLTIRPVRPEIWQAGDVTAILQQAPILAAYYLNPPLFDSHVFRAMAKQVEAHIREYNRVNNSNFFNDYPELRLATEPSSVLDNRVQAGAITAWYRDYLTRVTMYMGAMATHRSMAKLGGHSRFSRYGYAFRWSSFHTANRVMSDFLVPGSVKSYITKATRFLTGMNITGSPVIAFPVWRADIRGEMGVTETHMYGGSTGLGTIADADVAIMTHLGTLATTGAMGLVPNTLLTPAGINASNVHLNGPDADSNGKITGSIIANLDYWRNQLLTYNYDMSVPSSAMYQFFKQLGWVNEPIDIEAFDRSVRDNSVGDISTFAQHMAFASRVQAQYGMRTRVNLPVAGRTGCSYEKAGLHLNDEEWATLLATWEHGTETDDPLWLMDTMYAAAITATTRENAAGTVVAHFFNAGTSADNINAGLLVSGEALFAKLEDQLDFRGITPESVKEWLKPSIDPKVFINEAEYRKGVKIVRQVHSPLIDVWDPLMCGFYIIASSDEIVNNEWTRPFFDELNLYTRASGLLDMATEKDAVFFAGDGVLSHPAIAMSRVTVGHYVLYASQATTANAYEVIIGWRLGLPRVKPYTISPPGDIQPNLLTLDALETTAIRLYSAYGGSTPGAYTTFTGNASDFTAFWHWFLKELNLPDTYRHLDVLFTAQANGIIDSRILDSRIQADLALKEPYDAGANVLSSDTLKGLIVVPNVWKSGGDMKRASSSRTSSPRKGKFSKPKFNKSEELPIAKPSASVVSDPPAPEVLGVAEDEPKFDSKEKKFKGKKLNKE